MSRIAQRCCESLMAEIQGDAAKVIACHCVECQRRTGSTYGVGAYFKAEAVRTSGPSVTHQRPGTTGKMVSAHFCPTCGSTVYWHPQFMPGFVGVAVGAFADPTFPAPSLSAWEHSRHPWVGFEAEMVHVPRTLADG